MKHLALLLSFAALALGAPAPAADNNKLDLLRRALHNARAPQYESTVPYKINADYCIWSPHGDCWMNEAITSLYKYMKYDPPDYSKYSWYTAKYADDEGVYASGEDAMAYYQEALVYTYDLVNKHVGYGKYDYDAAGYIDDGDEKDKYCVWRYKGKCWTNDAVKYLDGVWKVKDDPYYKARQVEERRQADDDKSDYAVYSTSKGVQSWYAAACYDLWVAIDKWGPIEYDWDS